MDRLRVDCERIRPTHVLSLIDPGLPPVVIDPPVRHASLCFHDTTATDDAHAPSGAAIDAIVAFLEEVLASAKDAPVRLVVHCHHGQSRSPAAAFVALAMHLGQGNEAEAFAQMRRAAPGCWPNRLLVELADARLARNGALVRELDRFRTKFRPPGGARFLGPP